MRVAVALIVAAVGIGGARAARTAASSERPEDGTDEPYAPSPDAAPIVTLGYREAAADLLWIRMQGYFGGQHSTANGVATLAEAIIGLDPRFHRVYDYGANAMTIASVGVTQDTYQRAIAVLERGMAEFPDDWKLPHLASEIYSEDLVTTDPTVRRAWDEKSVALTETAIRKPGAPPEAAMWAATMRTKLGQHQRAVDGLREMILITTDVSVRKRLIDKLAKLEETDEAELAGELFEAKQRFEAAWQRDRPALNASMYLLLGPRIAPGFALSDLATGGRDLVVSQPIERLEPLE